MCGVRNGWIAVVDGAQKVVEGVAEAAAEKRHTSSASFFISKTSCVHLGKAVPPHFEWAFEKRLSEERLKCRNTTRTRSATAAAAPDSTRARSCFRSRP